jgi:hypothetical protein
VIDRRSLLAGAGGALVAAGMTRFARMARGDVTTAPRRLLVIYKPIGTVPAQYDCSGGERDFTLSPILAPFAPLREHMIILDGLPIRKDPNTPGEDHGCGIVTMMTGGVTFKAPRSEIAVAERASIDQLLARSAFSGDTPIPSLQIAADVRCRDMFASTLSYAGRGSPLPPEGRPFAVYAHVFGALADPGLDAAALGHARQRRQSVLDFARGNLSRLAPRLGAPERERLDRHLSAIRETERLLDRRAGFDLAPLESSVRVADVSRPDAHHGVIGRAHLDIVRAAFQCDLTRIVTFGWASGQSEVDFSHLLPDFAPCGHHLLTHLTAGRPDDEARIHRWYNQQIAAFLESLRDTRDVDGRSLLDNTLVVVWSEMRLGSHTFDNVPLVLFGGGLEGGRLLRFEGYSTNDLWLAIARASGLPLDHFGDRERCTGVLPGLFPPSPSTDPRDG